MERREAIESLSYGGLHADVAEVNDPTLQAA
jgi:hypothetical protein